jgi:LPXTG-motif cell wall-anchored protein
MKKNQFAVLAAAASVSMIGALIMPVAAYADTGTDDPSTTSAPQTAPTTATPTPVPTAAPSPTPTQTATPTPTPTALAQRLPATPTLSAGAAPAATEYKTTAVAARVTDNLSLTGGVLLLPQNGHVLLGPITNPVVPFNDNVLVIDGDYGPDAGPTATLNYQVAWHGQPTGYWISVNLTADSGDFGGSCDVYLGAPPAGGGPGADPSPYNCVFDAIRDFPKAGVGIHVSLNGMVEAQAVIQTQGPISLQGGHYSANLIPNHFDGSPTVGTNSSTRSDVVLNAGDQPLEPNLARTRFVYQIVDAGTARKFWVMGHSQNYDGNTKYTGESSCDVYDQDPLTAEGDPDLLKPVNVSAYTCTQTSWQFVNGDRGNYEATFAVAKRVMKPVTDVLEQRHLVAQLCGDMSQCGLSLASVQETYGVGRHVSSVVNNPSDTKDTLRLATSNSQSISNSGGFEIDVEGGVSELGVTFKTTLKVNYQRDVTNTTTTTQAVQIVIPPHSRGWIEGTPPMVHTVGEIIVHDGDRYLDLTNVVADFPDATNGHADWEYTTPNEPLPSNPVTGEEGGGGHAGSPIIALPITPASTSANAEHTSASTLAATGSTSDDATYLAGLLAILAGIGVVIGRRTRRNGRQARRG